MGFSTVILGGGRRATRTNRMQALKRPVPVGHWSTLKQEVPTLKLGSNSKVKTNRKFKGGLD